jgi:hypothetical protein
MCNAAFIEPRERKQGKRYAAERFLSGSFVYIAHFTHFTHFTYQKLRLLSHATRKGGI